MTSLTPTYDSQGGPPLDMDYIDRAMTFTPSECCTISCGTVCVDPRTSKVLIIFNRRLGIWQLPKGRKNIGEDLQSAALRETYEETGVHADLMPLKIRTRSTASFVASEYVPGAVGRNNDTAFHRTTLSTASASSASTAYSTSAASTASSAFTPSSTPISPGSSTLAAESDSYTRVEHMKVAAAGVRSITSADENLLHGGGHSIDYSSEGSRSVEDYTTSAAATDPKLTSDMFNNELVGVVQYPDLQAATPNTIKTVFFFAALADSSAPMGPGAQEDHEDLQAEWVDFQVANQRLRFGPEKEAMWKVRRDMERSGFKS